MKRLFALTLITAGVLFYATSVFANGIIQVPYSFISLTPSELDWSESADDSSSDKTGLGFAVTIEGRTYTHFDMDSNGYIQLLGPSDEPSGYGCGSLFDLMDDDLDDGEINNSYILAAYDDLSSEDYGYYGYKKYPDKIIFYYETQTFPDSYLDLDYLNNFEVILYKNGAIRWNFNYADYARYDYDLFTGLYLPNQGGFAKIALATWDEIPEQTSYQYGNPVPIPPSVLLLATGLGLFSGRRKTRS